MNFEERLSQVEAEIVEIKHQFEDALEMPFSSPSKKPGAVDAALEKIWGEVPDETWEKFPADFGENLDRYLYGSLKS